MGLASIVAPFGAVHLGHALPAGAQTNAGVGRPVLAVPRLEEIRPDGRLDEPVWTQASVARDFIQREPKAGEPAVERTEVFLFYNARAVFIGASLHDSDPSRIVSSEYLRDANLDANDSFEVMLDTFHDRRNAFYFQTNAVGGRRDALVRGESESANWEWDGIWDVAAARDERGWTVEMVIPFSTLRFKAGSGEGWGANFGRRVARTREERRLGSERARSLAAAPRNCAMRGPEAVATSEVASAARACDAALPPAMAPPPLLAQTRRRSRSSGRRS